MKRANDEENIGSTTFKPESLEEHVNSRAGKYKSRSDAEE